MADRSHQLIRPPVSVSALRWMATGLLAVGASVWGLALPAHAATISNSDDEPHTIVVTEQGVRSEIVVPAGEVLSFCLSGCFIILPNGDRAALFGPEAVEIVGGEAIINTP